MGQLQLRLDPASGGDGGNSRQHLWILQEGRFGGLLAELLSDRGAGGWITGGVKLLSGSLFTGEGAEKAKLQLVITRNNTLEAQLLEDLLFQRRKENINKPASLTEVCISHPEDCAETGSTLLSVI